MTSRYIRPQDYNRTARWMRIANLKYILDRLPDNYGIESGDLSYFLISSEDEYIGYIDMKDGEGKYISFKSVMDSLSVEEK